MFVFAVVRTVNSIASVNLFLYFPDRRQINREERKEKKKKGNLPSSALPASHSLMNFSVRT